jgi:hypothetical protein
VSDFLRLVRVELSRYLHRRAVLLLLLGCLAAPVLIGVITAYDTRPASADALADARAQMERDRADPAYEQQIDDCIENPDQWGIASTDPSIVEQQCRAQNEPQLDWYLYSPELDLDEQQDGSGVALGSLVAILLLLAGTTFTGHDWASRSVSNQLLFEPRRGRVWSAKALVVTAAALVVATVVMSAYWLGLAGVAQARDVLGAGQLLDALQMGWRTAGVAAGAALFGFALTTLFRGTVATIGILLGVAVAGSLLLAGIGVSERWNPAINLGALIEDGTYYYDPGCEDGSFSYDTEPGFDDGYEESCEKEITFTDASLYVGTGLLVACAASFLSFRRRDVP